MFLVVQGMARIGTRCAKFLLSNTLRKSKGCGAKCTSRQVADLSIFFKPSDRAAPRGFYLAIARHCSVGGVLLAVRAQPFAKLRSDKNSDRAHGSEPYGRRVVVDMSDLWWPHVHYVSPS
jgi:hypothetical protein